MAGINIPGVSDKYKTTDLIAGLMEVEKQPLKREQGTLETYKTQQDAWRNVNRQMVMLRESVRMLFSFENPFSTRSVSSSNEAAVTATANRNADFQSFKIDVLNIAHADRFLSGSVEKSMEVPVGRYTYSVADKEVTMDWKGGKLTDFVTSLNKRGNGLVRASLVGVSQGKQALLIGSLKTGSENRLGFADAAFDFAVTSGMIAPDEDAGPFSPLNPVETAADAVLKYEGITIERPTNSIDDIVPGVTIALHGETQQSATLKIEPDIASAKDALITFVGHYNQAIAELNILSQSNTELISELDYLSAAEKEAASERLGLFLGDFTLTNAKSTLLGVVTGNYQIPSNSVVSMLSQIGIATQADASGGFNASRLRGYLEINEKKLDAALQDNIAEIKNLFGYDSDGDLIVDSGIAYQLDQRLQIYTRRDGIITSKTSGLDTKIAASETKIRRLETQLDSKEAQLRQKYGQMEASLNSLESQSTSLENFSRQGQNNR
jgi:flagellar capping protein FliD